MTLEELIARKQAVLATLKPACGKTPEEIEAMSAADCAACTGFKSNEHCPWHIQTAQLKRLLDSDIYAAQALKAENTQVQEVVE